MQDDDALAALMARMADDRSTVVAFVDEYGDTLAAVVRGHLRSFGRAHLARDVDEVQGLVWSVALFLQERAGAWRAGGAAPWNWAHHGIRKLVADGVGHAVVDLDVDRVDLAWIPPARGGAEVDFASLAAAEPRLGLLHEAIATVPCTDRDRSVHVEYRIQWLLDDPSPAHTAAAVFGLRPPNVRQIDRRVRAKLVALGSAEPRFAPIVDLPWVTGRKRQPAAA